MAITDQGSSEQRHRPTLATLLRGRDFRRLLTARVLSQFSDGVFQASLASYVVFSPERQASPLDIASVLAVTLVPFSVIGPFTGVLLDRWRRRQVLYLGNLARSGICLLTAGLLLLRSPEWVFFGAALLVTGINRFILAGLGAALPRVVGPAELVTANSLSPTLGTLAATLGLSTGVAVHLVVPRGPHADALMVTLAGLLYCCAALAAHRMAVDLLGPERKPGRPALRAALDTAAGELAEAVRHLVRDCRPARHALVAMTISRFCYGVLFVVVLMLARNTYNSPSDTAAGPATLGQVIAVSAVGYFLAALISPWCSRRLGVSGWLTTCLAAAAVLMPAFGLPFTLVPTLAAALLLGLLTQSVKICTDTQVQRFVEDDYRGRVFALYDVLFNVAFVAAAALCALVLPASGRSTGVLIAVAAVYALAALHYARTTRPRSNSMR